MPSDEHLSQRMPEEMVEDLDAFAADMGVARNGAINLLVARGLREAGYRDAPRRQRALRPRRRPSDRERRGRDRW